MRHKNVLRARLILTSHVSRRKSLLVGRQLVFQIKATREREGEVNGERDDEKAFENSWFNILAWCAQTEIDLSGFRGLPEDVPRLHSETGGKTPAAVVIKDTCSNYLYMLKEIVLTL